MNALRSMPRLELAALVLLYAATVLAVCLLSDVLSAPVLGLPLSVRRLS